MVATARRVSLLASNIHTDKPNTAGSLELDEPGVQESAQSPHGWGTSRIHATLSNERQRPGRLLHVSRRQGESRLTVDIEQLIAILNNSLSWCSDNCSSIPSLISSGKMIHYSSNNLSYGYIHTRI